MPTEKQIARRARIKAKLITIGAWFKALFIKLEHELPLIADVALKVMAGFKIGINSGFVDFITRLTKSGYDDAIVAKARFVTEIAIDKLLKGKECLLKETFEEKLACLTELIKGMNDFDKNALFQQLHTEILAGLDDNKESLSSYAVQANLHHLIGKTEA